MEPDLGKSQRNLQQGFHFLCKGEGYTYMPHIDLRMRMLAIPDYLEINTSLKEITVFLILCLQGLFCGRQFYTNSL